MKKNTIYSTLLGLLLAGVTVVNAQTWSPVSGTENEYVNRLHSTLDNPNIMIATTSQDSLNLEKYNPFSTLLGGHGMMISKDGGNTFATRRMDSLMVFDAIKSRHHSNRWYATARYLDQGGIMISEDDGETWNLANMRCLSYSSQHYTIAESPFNPDYVATTALATDEGYNYTIDNFTTCNTNADFDIQSRCLAFSEVKPGLMFIGGDDSFADGVYRSLDSGKTWNKYESGLENLRVLSVWASNVNPALVYCGTDTVYDFADRLYMGRGIYASLDTGKTWIPVGASGSRVFDIKQHPSNYMCFAAAGNSEGVYVSSAQGFYWEKQSDGLPQGVEVRSVEIPNLPITETNGYDGFVCFAGTQGKGVYKSQPVYTGVEEDKKADLKLSLYPVPCNNKLNISWTNSEGDYCKVMVRDLNGNTVATILDAYCPKGLNSLSIEDLDRFISADGCYFISVVNSNGVKSSSFIKSR